MRKALESRKDMNPLTGTVKNVGEGSLSPKIHSLQFRNHWGQINTNITLVINFTVISAV